MPNSKNEIEKRMLAGEQLCEQIFRLYQRINVINYRLRKKDQINNIRLYCDGT